MRGNRKRRLLAVAMTVGVMIVAAALSGGVAAAESSGAPAAKVDINKASAKELMAVRGIGETLAKRIVEFRDANGPFRRIEDLMKIQGVGEKSFEKLRPHLTVGKKG